MAQTAQPTRTGNDPLDLIWWVTAAIGLIGVVYFGVMAYLVFSTMNWDVLFGDLTSNPGGTVSAPAAPPPPPSPELMPPPAAPPAPPVAPAPAPPAVPAPPTPPR